MQKRILTAFIALLILAGALNLLGGWLLPDHLLKAPVPHRTERQRLVLRAGLTLPGDRWTFHTVSGGEGVPFSVCWLHRPAPRGAVVSGAGHCEAGPRLPEGWGNWAQARLARWGLLD